MLTEQEMHGIVRY